MPSRKPYDDLLPIARNAAQQDQLKESVRQFRDEYREKRYRVLAVGENAVSSAVAGRSNFNSKQANQRGDALTRAEDEFSRWLELQQEGIKAKLLRLRTDEERSADNDAAETSRIKKLISPSWMIWP